MDAKKIDLEREKPSWEMDSPVMPEKKKPKKRYQDFVIRDSKEVEALKAINDMSDEDEVHKATIEFKIKRFIENKENKTADLETEIMSFEPMPSKGSKGTEKEAKPDSLEDSIKKFRASKKA